MPERIITISTGGVGDFIVAIPTYKALREKYPDHKIIVFCADKRSWDIVKSIPYIDSVRLLSFWGLIRYPYYFYCYYFNRKLVNYTSMDFQHIPLSAGYNKSVKEIIPEIFGIELKAPKIELFFTEEQERNARTMLAPYNNVVIMHIHSRSSANHHWPMQKWNELVRQLPEYTFIQLGHPDEPRVEGAVDWRGKTKILDAFCLLKHATSFVGIDSSFSHATNAFNTPGVVLFGDSNPIYWGHDNNINIFRDLPCCCFYELSGGACPYGNDCMNLITVEEVKKALRQQIAGITQKKELSSSFPTMSNYQNFSRT